ncbi:MAG TPA: septum formation initiator family protein [Clostridiales bacterium]|nr:septum formation initiator family protein [Clostridiales bacterium]
MNKKRYVIKPRIKVVVMLFIFVYLATIFVKQEFILREQNKETCKLETQIEQVREENSDLERQIEYTQSESYIERMAREKLGWVREGEKVFIEEKN